MRVFFDTSAFVKRYVEESGSQKVVEICCQAEYLVLSVICLPEMISMLSRLRREGRLSAEQYEDTKHLILTDFEDVDLCDLTPEVITRTIKCLENSALRAMDALHVGCALVIRPDLFVSSDRHQIEAAKREGLTVIEV